MTAHEPFLRTICERPEDDGTGERFRVMMHATDYGLPDWDNLSADGALVDHRDIDAAWEAAQEFVAR